MRSISPMPRANLSLPLNTSNLLGRTLGNSTVLVRTSLTHLVLGITHQENRLDA